MVAEAVSELSRLENDFRAKAARLTETAREAEAQAGSSGGPRPADLPAFLRRYYWQAPVEDVLDRSPRELADVALAHYALAQQRAQGTAVVQAGSLSDDPEQALGNRTVVQVVCADMPFLVDSVTAELSRLDRQLHVVVHPVLVVRRDIVGTLREVCDTADPGRCPDDGVVESWMHVEIDRETDSEVLREIENELRRVLNDVREAVEDWGKMRAAAVRIARELEARAAELPVDEADEAAELLRWLADDHFTFLGYREYRLETESGADGLRAVPSTGLGILRADSDMTNAIRVLPEAARAKARERTVLVLTKADSRSTVHRSVYLDYIGIKAFGPSGEVVGERRFLGLFSSAAYTESVTSIPVLRRRVAEVLERAHLPRSSHSGKDLLDILETYPRDELFQVGAEDLLPVVMSVLHLRERRQTRLFLRRDLYGRFYSALVFLPRDRYTTAVRLRFQEILVQTLHGASVEYTARSTESVLARLSFVIRVPKDEVAPDVDADELQEKLALAARSWGDDIADALKAHYGVDGAVSLAARYESAFSEGYKANFPAAAAVADLERLDSLSGDELALQLYVPEQAADGEVRFKIFRVGEPLLLSDVLPVLQHMGVNVVDERPYDVRRPDGARAWIYDFGLRRRVAVEASEADLARRFQDAFAAVWRGRAEDDGLNALVLTGGLTWRQVAVLRAYVRYLRQGGLTFSLEYVESCLASHVDIARDLVQLFEARFLPGAAADDPERVASTTAVTKQIRAGLAQVASLDEDRILSALLAAVTATLRTNYYQVTNDGQPHAYLSVKLDPHQLPELPEPRPFREIWVYSPRLEGVHLRFGAVARGGLRWSDRREDLRTEILGLVKAQIVKNTVIVPTGAKGGFVLKQAPDPSAGRDAYLAEGVSCYRTFISGLLDITDNLIPAPDGGTRTVAPDNVVRHDGDDAYLVVAADKGTATFSDIANGVAAAYDFWLGDAFASGGSAGYDHKAMGITARGAWESVKRHFRELGVDTQTQDFTVVGVGDMSGDVFGNGMLLSEHIRLVAAFDHRHIFLDPTPDAATSYAERRRLFELPRSSWADYDTALLSPGGAVVSRTAKRIEVSPEVLRALDLPTDTGELTPAALMKAILGAPVDLFWNGGIGTYVKASTENNADVGDKANDAIRVDGGDLRCRVIGEGGNLGCSQLGRIEFALAGGKTNTDAIDNSAGVDTSDHEVNIKILLRQAERDGVLDPAARNDVLAEMTDEIAELVLADNYDQNAALACESAYALSLLDVHQRYLRRLVRVGLLNRGLEFLPSDRQLAERQRDGIGLTAPEFSVLLAYTKIALTGDVLHSGLPDDPAVQHVLYEYFPPRLREQFRAQIDLHPLRREIITTQLVNELVNSAGITGVFRLWEEFGESTEAIARAHLAAAAIFDVGGVWGQAKALDNVVPAGMTTIMRLEACRLAERATRWLLTRSEPPLDIDRQVERFADGAHRVVADLPDRLRGIDQDAYEGRLRELTSSGVPETLARTVATFPKAISALDVVRAAELTAASIPEVCEVYFFLDERLSLASLLERVIALPRAERWQAIARAALRDDLNAEHTALTIEVLAAAAGSAEDRFVAWQAAAASSQQRALTMLAEIAGGVTLDLATLVVAVRVLRSMTRTAARVA